MHIASVTHVGKLLLLVFDTVQLKGNLKHADRAHATYWLKAHDYINPHWCVWEVKPANINFKRLVPRLRGHYRGSSHGYILFLQCLCTYMCNYFDKETFFLGLSAILLPTAI